ncbi:DUF924 family protein [Chitiniphilus eburneus]|uniref:DUF924 domain-containing protein n=1 Tax=Chitiniphilus eburneus TaxID=2571148 RepID=A0A4U0PBX4_9NEIS|nr:DUF924 family protein [Chitiniphilus eburneus]TJZ65203.1 DUF924 domain-containing protein [Chitiniphilus eburneus]
MSDLIRRASPEGRVKRGRSEFATPRQVLDFWFGAPDESGALPFRTEWFNGGAAFDARIRARFLPTLEAALAGGCAHWAADADGTLALLLMLDQFTRNVFRDTPRAFAGDPVALAMALRLLENGWHRELAPVQQVFAYLPFEHSEVLSEQDRSVALTRAWPQDDALALCHGYALRHRDVIRRFGRFPHRNAILGRATTARENDFLAEHGGF